MQARRSWISDELEGLAIAADGRVFTVIGNNSFDDASGESQLLGVKDEQI